MILLASPDIVDYQAVQEQCGQLRIHLTVAPQASFGAIAQAVVASVEATVAQYACRPARLSVEEGLEPLSPGVKRRRVKVQKR